MTERSAKEEEIRTESSGGAGDHPHRAERDDRETGGEGDPKVDELHEDAVTALREGGPSPTRHAPDDTIAGG